MKLSNHIEWRIVEDSIFIVNTDSNKVFSGNKSVRMVFEEMLIGADSEREIVDRIIKKYKINQDKYEDVYNDVLEIITLFFAEGVFE